MLEKALLILVVEEANDDHASAMIARLRSDGHEVHLASDEIAARVLGRKHQLDAAIVFLRPRAGSIELARYMRTNIMAQESPLVAIDPGGIDAEASDTQAFDVVLREPIDLPQFSGLLHHLRWQRRR